jgi:Tat protein translocase TatB subunit
MFGSLGGPEILFLFVLALLLFGPRKLPEIGRTIGKAMVEFRRATNDFRVNLEREIDVEKLKETRQGVIDAGREVAREVRDATRLEDPPPGPPPPKAAPPSTLPEARDADTAPDAGKAQDA